MKRGIRITLAVLVIASIMALGIAGCAKQTATITTTTTPTQTATITTTTTPTQTATITTTTTPTPAKVIKLKWSTPYFEMEGPAQAGNVFCKTVEEATGGRVQIERYYGETLGKAMEHLSLVQSGAVDMASFMVPYFPTELPIHALLASTVSYVDLSGVPGSTMEARQAGQRDQHAIMYDIPETKAMLDEEEQRVGVKFFEPLSVGPSAILSTKESKSLADLQGLKLGSPIPSVAEVYGALGMTPVTIQIMDTYESLSRGVIDCSSMVLSVMEVLKWYEPCKSYLDTSVLSWGVPMCINMEVWNSLPADIQQAFGKANEAYVKFALEQNYEADMHAIQTFKDAGLYVGAFPAADIKAYLSTHEEIADIKYSIGIMCPPEYREQANTFYFNYAKPMQEGTYWK